MTTQQLEYLYHHIFFPTRVPHYDDQKGGAGDRALCNRLNQLAPLFRDQCEEQFYSSWSTICRMLRTFSTLHRDNKSISRSGLLSVFQDLRDGDIVTVHIAIQNSALILRKHGSEYIVESFEVSAPAAEVLCAQGALRWDFPSRAVALKSSVFDDPLFQISLVQFLEKASVEPVKQFAATSLKAGSLAFESRDTPTPAIVGQLLMAILEANGRNHIPMMTQKRVQDEVCWGDGAENPWRRSATWLVLRVGLQRALCFLFGGSVGTIQYKFFICYIMSSILQELCGHDACPADRVAFARTKLARRVAKLKQEKHEAPSEKASLIDCLLKTYGNSFRKALRAAEQRLEASWESIRARTLKRVLPLPRRADPGSTTLSLVHSSGYLQRVMAEALYGSQPTRVSLGDRPRITALPKFEPVKHSSVIDYLNLANLEATLLVDTHIDKHLSGSSGFVCSELMRKMHEYQTIALSAYNSDPENLSLMVLNLLELWRELDSRALLLYPLLAEYDPGFPLTLLYPLQISKGPDMHRLLEIEQYLEHRRSTATTSLPSVFGNLSRLSFTVRFFDQCDAMQEMLSIIKCADENAKARKEQELKHESAEYENRLREAAHTACLFMEDEFDPLKRQHDDRRCRKHYLERVAARMRIQIHEALLPSDEVHAKAVVFELLLPQGFAAWRDSTWRLLQLARPHTYSDRTPQVLLREYPGLRAYVQPISCNLTLASRTKSFHNTHYAKVPFPTALDQVCLPHGLKYGLYDHEEALWASRRQEEPSFADLCAPRLQTNPSYAVLKRYLHPTFEGKNPSGNDIIASQTHCPNALTIAEYTAFQGLRLGTEIQWIRLLRELGSSNLNFGTSETGALVAELALMVGPPDAQSPLRAIHWVFRDPAFCAALAGQIKRRLEGVAANWREGQTVQCLSLILLRIWSLTPLAEAQEEAEALILYVRRMTHDWIRILRHEMCTAPNVETAQQRSKDGLLASLLCRRTFMIEAAHTDPILRHDALACFLECGFTLKDNLPRNEPGYIANMPGDIRKLFLGDIKLVFRLQTKLRDSIENLPAAVDQAVNSVWAQAEGGSPRQFSRWCYQSAPHDGWISAQSTGVSGMLQQSVHIDVLEGTLLVDGQHLGRLPDEFTKEGFFRQMFGNRVFLTYPSGINGMSYMLAGLFQGHEIHFGFRNGVVFLRARLGVKVLELLPQDIFRARTSGDAPDLPLPLVNDSIHWLDLGAQVVEIRPHATMWQAKQSNWKINLRTSQAMRRTSLLVDPRSSIFNRISQLIESFEDRRNIVIYQPATRNLAVHLPGLELSFGVSYKGFLESHQLRAVVDNDQDAGTLYGLHSSLVLRDLITPEDRSIIVAMGPAKIETLEGHVSVRTVHTGFYARFFINKVLGRLECAPEPRLIYFKAYCHAVTGYLLPDPLTGRTGADEAISCLRAGSAQPWAPVDGESYRILSVIAQLSPQRIYYPEKLKVLQKVIWSEPFMPASLDHRFGQIVKDIMDQCRLLHQFHIGSDAPPEAQSIGDEHLLMRANLRKQSHEIRQAQTPLPVTLDSKYIPRDCTPSMSTKNAYEAAFLTKQWSSKIAVSCDLISILQEWPTIQGFDQDFTLFLFADLIKLDLASNWGSLFKLCQTSTAAQDRFKLMFLFATISFDAHIDMNIIRSLIAVSIMDDFKAFQLPRCSVFTHFRRDQVPTIDYIVQYIKPYRIPYPEDERTQLSGTLHSKQRRKLDKAQEDHEEQSYNDCLVLARHLLSQWPCLEPSVSNLDPLSLLDSELALLVLKPEWSRLFNNYEFSQHLARVQSVLDTCSPPKKTLEPLVEDFETDYFPMPSVRSVQPTMEDIIRKLKQTSLSKAREPLAHLPSKAQWDSNTASTTEIDSMLGVRSSIVKTAVAAHTRPESGEPATLSELEGIVASFTGSENPTRRAYGKDMEKSIHSLATIQKGTAEQHLGSKNDFDAAKLEARIASAFTASQDQLTYLRTSLTDGDPWIQLGALLPYVTPVTLLEVLPASTPPQRDILIAYAELLLRLQYLLRIRKAYQRRDHVQLANEIRQEDTGFHARNHIDWLLLQLDFDLCIRRDQYEVARAMLAPKNAGNFVLQMNMGQGKSSVIIPMLVSQLADGKNLVRVVVPRPLLLQTAQLLQTRLGGLIGRRVKHIPFSRRTSTDLKNLKAYHDLHIDMMQNQGVVLTLPEHMLSFQLSGLQELSYGHEQQARSMIRLQAWLRRKCRDILDECDHMLAVKTQLIYPSGGQKLVDAHPTRWYVVQDLLKLVTAHLAKLRHEFPKSIEIINRAPGTFPTIYLLDQAVKDALIRELIDSILNGDGDLLPIQGRSHGEVDSVGTFLRDAQFPKALALKVAGVFREETDARHRLLILRGLLIHKILLLSFGKRWNVQYGIDPRRDPIAVPFRSKGIPSDQAEFGHPDVSIILTCLSFYYTGLNLSQFRQNLNLLLRSDEPAREFELWKKSTPSFPESLASFDSINVDDESRCTQLWTLLRQQVPVINYFLNHLVFPRYARTFERKLVSSGWDIAPPPGCAARSPFSSNLKENMKPGKSASGQYTSLSVGFSGTNDNKTLLPLNVVQRDLPGLSHTNAEVLTYLLQPRNRAYYPACDLGGRRLTESGFLKKLKDHSIRILLDAGAQILELDNISLAKTWLQIEPEAEAAVYFGEDGRARVIHRDGKGQPLAGSPYLDNLGSCVIYLDEAHTRGVDLKMPADAKAALTLGIMQTKDHTVQAAMRLRQLAISQSITFFAPPEVHQSILNLRRKTNKDLIDSRDVIIWLLEQTCCNIEQLQPLYISQGLEFCRRQFALERNPDAATQPEQRKALLKVLEQPEQYSLERLYSPDQRTGVRSIDAQGSVELAKYVEALNQMKKGLRETGDTVQALTHQEVEQEREVQIEVEQEREVKKPNHAQALPQPPLQRDIRLFAETGRLIAGSQAYQQAFIALRHTALGRRLGVNDSATKSRLFVTQDFSSTVVRDRLKPRDEYSRSVHWMIWSAVADTALVVSDFEADALLPTFRDRKYSCTHIITYAAPITKQMIQFDTLKFYTVPSLPNSWRAPTWLVRDLGIFAGRLYFNYDEQYRAICEFMGMPVPDSLAPSSPPALTENDLWNVLPYAEILGEVQVEAFSPAPLEFMQEWLGIRRKGHDFSQTMMGELCRGRTLIRDDTGIVL